MSYPTVKTNENDGTFDRAYASLIGLAIGDSIGDQARSVENQRLFGITRDMYSNASWSTDDTEFALLVASELIESKGDLTIEHVIKAWMELVVAQNDLGDKGGESEKGAVNNLRRGILPPLSGNDNSYNDSDGAAMRIVPVGIVCAGDPERAARLAGIEASISHAADGIWGAQAIAAGVAVAMKGASCDEIVLTSRRYIPDDSWLGRRFDRAMKVVADAGGDLWKAWSPLHLQLRSEYRAANAEAIPEIFALFKLTKGDFIEGVLTAANFGRDSDTLAALVGAISGAKNGLSVIPIEWIEKVRRPSGRCLKFTNTLDIQQVAIELAKLIG